MKDRLGSIETILQKLTSVPDNCATTLRGILETSQQVWPNSPSVQDRGSGLLGEVDDDGSILGEAIDTEVTQGEAADTMDQSLSESIQRLGRLVQAKERRFDTVYESDDEADAITEDLDRLLESAKQQVEKMARESAHAGSGKEYGEAARTIARFSKGYARYGMVVNPKGKAY